jgi:hypothetical protein
LQVGEPALGLGLGWGAALGLVAACEGAVPPSTCIVWAKRIPERRPQTHRYWRCRLARHDFVGVTAVEVVAVEVAVEVAVAVVAAAVVAAVVAAVAAAVAAVAVAAAVAAAVVVVVARVPRALASGRPLGMPLSPQPRPLQASAPPSRRFFATCACRGPQDRRRWRRCVSGRTRSHQDMSQELDHRGLQGHRGRHGPPRRLQ